MLGHHQYSPIEQSLHRPSSNNMYPRGHMNHPHMSNDMYMKKYTGPVPPSPQTNDMNRQQQHHMNSGPQAPTMYPRSASEAIFDSSAKFRQLPCRTFISVGTCPYRERCVYLHDPRCICREAKTKTRRKNKEDMVLDSMFWPIMPYQVVASKLDTNRQPHVIQSYNVPPPLDDQFHRHDLAVYSIWMHFVDFCLANSESTTYPYADSAPCFSAPDFPVNSYTKLPRLPVFRVLSTDQHRGFLEIPREEFVHAKSPNNLHIPMDEKDIASMTSSSSYLQSANTVDSVGIAGMYEASNAAAGGLPLMKSPSPSPNANMQPLNMNGMRNGPPNRLTSDYDPYLPPVEYTGNTKSSHVTNNNMYGEYTPEKMPSFRSNTSPNAVSNMMLSPSHSTMTMTGNANAHTTEVKSFPSMMHPTMNMNTMTMNTAAAVGRTSPMHNPGMYSTPSSGYAGDRGSGNGSSSLLLHQQSARGFGMSPIPSSSVVSYADPSEDNTSTDSFEPTTTTSATTTGTVSTSNTTGTGMSGYPRQSIRPRADSLTSNDELDLPVDEHDAMIAAMVREHHSPRPPVVVMSTAKPLPSLTVPAPSLGHPMVLIQPTMKELYHDDKLLSHAATDRTSPDTPSGLWHHQETLEVVTGKPAAAAALSDEYLIEDDRLLSHSMSLPSCM